MYQSFSILWRVHLGYRYCGVQPREWCDRLASILWVVSHKTAKPIENDTRIPGDFWTQRMARSYGSCVMTN